MPHFLITTRPSAAVLVCILGNGALFTSRASKPYIIFICMFLGSSDTDITFCCSELFLVVVALLRLNECLKSSNIQEHNRGS